jgi:hypothetical protein
MSDLYPVDPTEIRQRGMKGVMSAIGGVGLLGVNALIHIPVVGWVIGGALALFGIMGLLKRDKSDKAANGIMLAAGAAGLATIFLPHLTGFLLGSGAVALLAYGGFNIYKFVKGLKSRA